MKIAVQQNGWALQFASRELKTDPNIVLAAVQQYGSALEFASTELQADPDIALPSNATSARTKQMYMLFAILSIRLCIIKRHAPRRGVLGQNSERFYRPIRCPFNGGNGEEWWLAVPLIHMSYVRISPTRKGTIQENTSVAGAGGAWNSPGGWRDVSSPCRIAERAHGAGRVK